MKHLSDFVNEFLFTRLGPRYAFGRYKKGRDMGFWMTFGDDGLIIMTYWPLWVKVTTVTDEFRNVQQQRH